MDIFEKVKSINLPLGQYCVVGSGPLGAHGLREVNDVDISVTPSLYKALKDKGWQIKHYPNGDEYLSFDCFEACVGFSWKNYHPDPMDQIKEAEIVNDVPFLRLQELVKWKKEFGREKDLKDIALIEDYFKKTSL